MRPSVLACALFLVTPVFAQKPPSAPQPTQFEVGRRTFFDFGPPFDYYEILVVRAMTDGTSIERITLTPAGFECFAPAKMEVTSVSVNEAIGSLLGKNPCAIPEKDLRRELKRCKKCSVFSGANVTMQVQCGSEPRFITSKVLDRDMFDPRANTPQQASWTMQLLSRLDKALGPGVMDKPIFRLPDTTEIVLDSLDPAKEQELRTGTFDRLFEGAPDKPSDLYKAARTAPLPAPVALESSSPISPIDFVPPEYPPLAKMARARGMVSFTVDVDAQGMPSSVIFVNGSALFYASVKTAVSQWRFAPTVTGAQVHATIGFGLSCLK